VSALPVDGPRAGDRVELGIRAEKVAAEGPGTAANYFLAGGGAGNWTKGPLGVWSGGT
jgi:hypothetical protein